MTFDGWRVVAGAFLVLCLAYGTQYSFGIFFAALLDEFGWSRASLSGVFSLYAFAYCAFGFPAGRLTDRWGPRAVITAGGVFLGSALAGMALVTRLCPVPAPARAAATRAGSVRDPPPWPDPPTRWARPAGAARLRGRGGREPMTTEIAGLTVETVEPRGPARPEPVLFVHGMWGGAWMWEAYMEFFAARGWRCHALNLRGHHGSRPAPDIGRVSIHDYVADARAVAEALGRPVVIGHSMGGLLAQKLAELLAPPAVVAVTPAAPRGVLALSTLELVRAALRHLPEILGRRPLMPAFAEMEALELNRLPAAERRAVYARMVPESGRMTFDIAVTGLRVDARRVRGPMLVVAGADDRITPATMVRRVARRYGATLREYPGFAHMLLMEPGWERIAGDIADWLEMVTRSAGVAAGRESR